MAQKAMVFQLMEVRCLDFLAFPLKASLNVYLQGLRSAKLHSAAEPAPELPLTPRKHFQIGKMLCNKIHTKCLSNWRKEGSD